MIELADEIVLKVLGSLSLLAVASIKARNNAEKEIAQSAMTCEQLRIVLHFEQPTAHNSALYPALNPANIKQKLQQLIQSIDPHPQVVEMSQMRSLGWSVNSSRYAEERSLCTWKVCRASHPATPSQPLPLHEGKG